MLDYPPGAHASAATLHLCRVGSKDGAGAGDCDQPYVFGRRISSVAPGPFTLREYARLLVLRSRLRNSL
jgi:hypothetical protein